MAALAIVLMAGCGGAQARSGAPEVEAAGGRETETEAETEIEVEAEGGTETEAGTETEGSTGVGAEAPRPVLPPPTACSDRDAQRAVLSISEAEWSRTTARWVELDGLPGEELLVSLSERPRRSGGVREATGSMRIWLLRCHTDRIELVTANRFTYRNPPDAELSPISTGIEIWSTQQTTEPPFRALLVQISSRDGRSRWRRTHVYVLERRRLREVLACLDYWDAGLGFDGQPDLQGVVRDRYEGPGLEIQRRYHPERQRRHRRGRDLPLSLRAEYAWDGARLVARDEDICADDPAPRDAPPE